MQKKLFYILCLSIFLTSVALANPSYSSVPEQHAEMQLPNFSKLVKQVGSSVVNITADVSVRGQNQQIIPNLDPNDPFYQFFRHAIPNQPRAPQKSFGSGFILSSDGYILTNAHVISGAKKITVRTTDKQELLAKLIGTDSKTDIALLKINAKNLNAVKIGNPNNLDIGEWVAAIGAPFGFENTVTQGIVSAKGRNLPDGSYVPFIQTDVPINPGNSGGPLFNLNGEVVGINSQIYSNNGGYMGLSFSIPIDIAMNVVNQLKQTGRVEHGLLGVQIQSVTSQIAKSFGLPKAVGALVSRVTTGSSGDKAGIKAGDVILRVDNTEINDASSLPMIIGSKKPGDKIPLVVFRNGQELQLVATLGGASEDAVAPKVKSMPTLKLDKFGLTISNLERNQLQDLGVRNGVLVTDSNGIGQMSGIAAGDVILSVDNQIVTNVNQVKNMTVNKTTVAFLILRDGQQMFITISLG
jgi:serine protease Do